MKKFLGLGVYLLSLVLISPSAAAISFGSIKGGVKDVKDVAGALSISTRDEMAYGKAMHPYMVLDMGGAHRNRSVQNYVNSVGQKLVRARAVRPGMKYTFTVVNHPMVNAFAMPGGYVYVTRGMLKLMKDEAELAAVLGHEIGHVEGKHGVKRLQKALLVKKGSKYAAKGAGKAGGRIAKEFAKQLSKEFSAIALAGYGRKQETDSDKRGVKRANAAGYDPAGATRLFEGLLSLKGSAPKSAGSSLYASHPETKKRIKTVKKEINKLSNKGSQTNKSKYLTMSKKF